MQKFIAIGNKVRVDGHLIECKEFEGDIADFSCKCCFFNNYDCPVSPFYCNGSERKDKTDVYFEEVKE